MAVVVVCEDFLTTIKGRWLRAAVLALGDTDPDDELGASTRGTSRLRSRIRSRIARLAAALATRVPLAERALASPLAT